MINSSMTIKDVKDKIHDELDWRTPRLLLNDRPLADSKTAQEEHVVAQVQLRVAKGKRKRATLKYRPGSNERRRKKISDLQAQLEKLTGPVSIRFEECLKMLS